MTISEIRVWLVKGTSALKAKVDVTLITELGELSLKGFRVVQSAKGPFIGPPQEKYSDKTGKTAYKDLLWLGHSLQQALYPKIIEAFKREVANHTVS